MRQPNSTLLRTSIKSLEIFFEINYEGISYGSYFIGNENIRNSDLRDEYALKDDVIPRLSGYLIQLVGHYYDPSVGSSDSFYIHQSVVHVKKFVVLVLAVRNGSGAPALQRRCALTRASLATCFTLDCLRTVWPA